MKEMENTYSIKSIYGINLFSNSVMQERLPKNVFNEICNVQKSEAKLTPELAEKVALVMKNWATEKGATHFSHWFQPLTGSTAEKYDSFIEPTTDGNVLLSLSRDSLLQGEPDASSFPSGGLRETFEARGYTAWDTSSPAFIREDEAGKTLTIPTVYISYHGHALDAKTPLLKSMESLNQQSIRVLRALGNNQSRKVIPRVGPEQEYFLIDRKYYENRSDLQLTGRTIFGSMPAKGQELNDHYFGAINDRVKKFMTELNDELWKLGISAKTQHNEVAPNQFELANIYDTANISSDTNQITMELMDKIAKRHDLVCLLHEKPFKGVNGSGKHNNWSIATDDGINLLDPKDNPHENKQFLLFLVSVIKAVDLYASLLRASASCYGNDHRLGGHEAPPAIVSIFLGEHLTSILDSIASGNNPVKNESEFVKMGVSNLPRLQKDSTDRNRTSPFAFTGNRFEFRMVPSSGSIADPNIVLNTAVADILSIVADRLENADDIDAEVDFIIKDFYSEHKRIIFNGDGYSKKWKTEAEKRGLKNYPTTIDVLPELTTNKTVGLFTRQKVFSKQELDSRFNIRVEKYINQINIEAGIMCEISIRQIVPACLRYLGDLSKTLSDSKTFLKNLDTSSEEKLLREIQIQTSGLIKKTKMLDETRNKISKTPKKEYFKGLLYKDRILPLMKIVRNHVDSLEMMVAKEYWPLASYEDMLYKL